MGDQILRHYYYEKINFVFQVLSNVSEVVDFPLKNQKDTEGVDDATL